MQEMALTEWLGSKETQALRVYLRRKVSVATQEFLQGRPVDPMTQARAAACHELDLLLSQPLDKIREVFNQVREK